MKSAMPFRGVPSPSRRQIVRAAITESTPPTREDWLAAVTDLWRNASYREERYAALDLLATPRFRKWRDPSLLPLCEELVVAGAWWDLVDAVAIIVRGLFINHPDEMTPLMRAWSRDANLWKRRVSIICQLGSKERLDRMLLEEAIEGSIEDGDFFARKAIGWALRDASRCHPAWVRGFVERQGTRLSGLSRREGLKHLT